MNDFNMTFESDENMNMQFRELQMETPTEHNDLSGRDAAGAHPISAISQLAETLADKASEDYVDAEVSRVEGEIPTLEGYATEEYVDSEVGNVRSDVDDIEAKIPPQATSTNKLADKEFVNSSISTNTATFRGTFTSTDDFPTTGVDDNDYVFLKVMSTEEPTQVERYDRYKWNGTQFAFEFSLNNSSFTAEQWAAINSGITANDVTTIKEDIQQLQTDTIKGVQVAGTDLVKDADGKVNVPIAVDGASGTNGVSHALSSHGIQTQSNGLIEISGASANEILNRNNAYKPITTSSYDSAVKHALCDADGTKNPAYTDAEKTGAWGKLTNIKTTLGSVAVAGTSYFLGEQTEVSISLPSDALTGQQISVIFYSGATATSLSVSGTVIGDVPTPTANQRVELNFLWDGTNWAILSNTMSTEVSA